MMRRIKRIFISALGLMLMAMGGHAAKDANDSLLSLEQALIGVHEECPGEIKRNLALVEVEHLSDDGKIRTGQIVIDRRLAEDIKKIFELALQHALPIKSAIPISQFDWNDDLSMASNNTSAFNYRPVTGGKKLSNHSYGFAIDINPFLNPYIKGGIALPEGAIYDPAVPGTLSEGHPIVQAFLDLGWEWGGHWQSLKDYQHFEKVLHQGTGP